MKMESVGTIIGQTGDMMLLTEDPNLILTAKNSEKQEMADEPKKVLFEEKIPQKKSPPTYFQML